MLITVKDTAPMSDCTKLHYNLSMMRHHIHKAISIFLLLLVMLLSSCRTMPVVQTGEEAQEEHILLVQDPVPKELEEEYPIAPYSHRGANG